MSQECPSCMRSGCTHVLDTRGSFRRRHCEACGATWETREVLIRGSVRLLREEASESVFPVVPSTAARPAESPRKGVSLVESL